MVLKADGTNCEAETHEAFKLGGGNPEIVMVNQLKNREKNLLDYQILAMPGGFAYGDDLGAGKILALELQSYLADQINEFTQRKNGLIIGICNGFQALVRTGLLPLGTIGEIKAILDVNNSGKFDCRPVKLKVQEDNACVFLQDIKGIKEFKVAHGEGRFYTSQETLDKVEMQRQVVFRYCDVDGNPTQKYPENPNGSMNSIAAICDSTGRILGIMPHPERAVKKTQYDNWRRMGDFKPEGLQIFEKMVNYAKQM